jgi:hypothetical protein
MFIECSNELGGFESGVVARFFGPVASVVSGGIGTLVVLGVIASPYHRLPRQRFLMTPGLTCSTVFQTAVLAKLTKSVN